MQKFSIIFILGLLPVNNNFHKGSLVSVSEAPVDVYLSSDLP